MSNAKRRHRRRYRRNRQFHDHESRVRELEAELERRTAWSNQQITGRDARIRELEAELWSASTARDVAMRAADRRGERVRDLETQALDSAVEVVRRAVIRAEAAESRLAAATALAQSWDTMGAVGSCRAALIDVLAGQPAAPDPADRVLRWAGPAARADLAGQPAAPTRTEAFTEVREGLERIAKELSASNTRTEVEAKRSPERAVEALDRIRRELVEGATGQPYQVTVFEITKVLDAWTAGDPWEERLAELAERRGVKP